MSTNDSLIIPRFYIHTILNEAKSKEEGRPIFDNMEVCEIRMAANRQTVGVFPATEVCSTQRNFATGEVEEVTYASRFQDLYKKFKDGEAQDMSGTPLSELPFLTEGKRRELKALDIHTAETLSALDGPSLKRLGMGGRALKDQAQAYLDNAAGSADITKLAAENQIKTDQIRDLQRQIDEMNAFAKAQARTKADSAPIPVEDPQEDESEETDETAEASPFEDWNDDDIGNWIESEGGKRPRSNASHKTMVKEADKLNAELAKKNKQG